jgi:hypothetical protein
MVAAETSYMARGNFLDMEEGIARQYHLKPRRGKVLWGEVMGLEHRRMPGHQAGWVG